MAAIDPTQGTCLLTRLILMFVFLLVLVYGSDSEYDISERLGA